jgi:hypothetical protein
MGLQPMQHNIIYVALVIAITKITNWVNIEIL